MRLNRLLRALRAAWLAFRSAWKDQGGRYRITRNGREVYVGDSAREMQAVWRDGKRSGGSVEFWDGDVKRDWWPR